MHRGLDAVATTATLVALTAAFLLIGASLVGLGGSLPLVALLAVAAVVFRAGRERLPPLGSVAGWDLNAVVEELWLAPLVAVLAVALVWGASPGEVQSVGGLVGLAGMVNHFLRPVYQLGYAAVRRVRGAVPE